MILDAMLQRLFQSLLKGPSLNARPHNSRQRIDMAEFAAFGAPEVGGFVRDLLERGKLECPAAVPPFVAPVYPEQEWSDEQKEHRNQWERQGKLLRKLSGIAADAKDYFNDHGEEALFVGYPLLSLPPGQGQERRATRILAPVAMIPITLSVRLKAKAGVTVRTSGDGADRLIPNPALLAWIEQTTGEVVEDLFSDEGGDAPWRELAEILAVVSRSVGAPDSVIGVESGLVPIPRAEGLSHEPALLSSAVLGLFPMTNPGLLRDTRWMIDHEEELAGPVRSFLKKEAIYGEEPESLPAAEELGVETQAAFSRDFQREHRIARADPCQGAAVDEAARAQALVIHGPPGTGKSQTISNIIGDHLARGERVLFVCDKRTALDVVKYRLDALGIGDLCGVIHDPQRDRRDFYMGLRARLEALAENDLPPDPKRSLKNANARLAALHQELREAYGNLHREGDGGDSFHSLVGEWMELRAGEDEIALRGESAEGVHRPGLEASRTDVIEVLERGRAAALEANPLFEALAVGLEDYFAKPAGTIEEEVDRIGQQFERVSGDEIEDLPPLPEGEELESVAARRERLAVLLAELGEDERPAELQAVLTEADLRRLRQDWDGGRVHREALEEPLDRELQMQLAGAIPALGVINQNLMRLQAYLEASRKWTGIFAFGKKREAGEVLAGFALAPTVENLERGVQFFEGLKSRTIVVDFLGRLVNDGSSVPVSDDVVLRAAVATVASALEIRECVEADRVLAKSQLLEGVVKGHSGASMASRLTASAKRAGELSEALAAAEKTGLFRREALEGWRTEIAGNGAAVQRGWELRESKGSIETLLRLEDRLGALEPALRSSVRDLALRGVDPETGLTVLACKAVENEIDALVQASPELARIDTIRIDAALSELQERMQEKLGLVRRMVARSWQERQSQRVLASTGSRLNSEGASLRQRLYVRGQKALKLRQMIAAGETAEGGDPLFDLCPVWMASPSTVAQIFPRVDLFDVVIFDEASQCRLEEALPVLLRGKRVVVAGDPKQLPPTRFFEAGVVESDSGDFESVEDLHQQQMAEMEDLLSAALNLDVAESFLDVHYRSRNEALIGFSNEAFYGERLQPIPGHPKNKALSAPIHLTNVDGIYAAQSNRAEGLAVVEKIADLLSDSAPPSIGVATFNLKQRNLILELIDERCSEDDRFRDRLAEARERRGEDSFEGLFVKNLENVQGDERDHIIVSTTFGRDEEGKFRRNFGALSRVGGERRLNVLVTRARAAVHILTSIPTAEYRSEAPSEGKPNGRIYLYSYLRYAERLRDLYEKYHDELETMRVSEHAECEVWKCRQPSRVAAALGEALKEERGVGSTVHWGNDGFMVDAALTHPRCPEDVTVGVLTDFNRYRNTPDPIDWELFRTEMLRSQGWELVRLWSPKLFRDLPNEMKTAVEAHLQSISSEEADEGAPERAEESGRDEIGLS